MEKDSPFAKFKTGESAPVSNFPFTYIMFCDHCKGLWKSPTPGDLRDGGTNFLCKFCKDPDNTARCLAFYENDAPRI